MQQQALDIFPMSDIELIEGDCLEVMPDIENGSVDMVMADPPYGTTACKWDSIIPLEPMWKQLKRVIKPNGAIVLFGSEPFSSALRMSNIKNYKYDWIWDKVVTGIMFTAKKQPMRIVENIIVFNSKIYLPIMNDDGLGKAKERLSKKPKKQFKKTTLTGDYTQKTRDDYTLDSQRYSYPKNILKYNRIEKECNSRKRIHPTQKPVALMEYLIKTYTNAGETVLDFCMGSGTTGVACKNLNRNFIGIEKDPEYFEIARNRIN